MEIKVIAGGIQATEDELIVVNLFEGVETPGGATGAVDKALGGAITRGHRRRRFSRQEGRDCVLFYSRGAIPARRVLVVGLGPAGRVYPGRRALGIGRAAQKARELGVTSFSSIVHGAGAGGLRSESAAQAVVEGTILGLYRYQELKNKPPDRPDPERFTLVQFDAGQGARSRSGRTVGQIVAEAACLARDLVNRPANYATPTDLADLALRDRRRV